MKNSSLISRILSSIFFKRANAGAARYARNSRSLVELIREAIEKSGGLTGGNFAAFRDQLGVVTRLLKAYASGEYREVPWKTLLRMIAVLVYFVSPLDFLPDFLPVVGLTDDIALMLWLFSGIKDDIEKFRQWENPVVSQRSESPRRTETIKIG
ncbi:YkvA family protein [Spirosoma gilvum]